MSRGTPHAATPPTKATASVTAVTVRGMRMLRWRAGSLIGCRPERTSSKSSEASRRSLNVSTAEDGSSGNGWMTDVSSVWVEASCGSEALAFAASWARMLVPPEYESGVQSYAGSGSGSTDSRSAAMGAMSCGVGSGSARSSGSGPSGNGSMSDRTAVSMTSAGRSTSVTGWDSTTGSGPTGSEGGTSAGTGSTGWGSGSGCSQPSQLLPESWSMMPLIDDPPRQWASSRVSRAE